MEQEVTFIRERKMGQFPERHVVVVEYPVLFVVSHEVISIGQITKGFKAT